MSASRSRLRRFGTGTAVAALFGSAILFAAPAQAANKVIDDLHVNADETRSAGHNEFLSDGVRVYTDDATSQAKAAAYFEVNKPLADAGEPNMDWENNGQTGNVKPSVQLVVDYDGNGTPDGILVGEPTYADGSPLYGNDWWLTNGSAQGFKDIAPSHGGGFGSANHGTLDEWRAAASDAEVLSVGWSLGSGVKGDGIIHRISVGSTNYFFAKAAVSDVTLFRSDFDLSQTRSTGHNDFRPVGGIRVYTEGATSTDKAAGYFPVNTPLAGTGEPKVSFRMTSGTIPPSTQLGVDFDNDGDYDGILVGEPKFYGNDWWLSNNAPQEIKDLAPSHTGGSGSANHGTLNQWRAVFPDAKILTGGYSLGSGVKADGVLSSITIGSKRYIPTGLNRAPSAEDVTGEAAGGDPASAVDITLVGTDPDTEDTLTFTSEDPDHGTVSIEGSTLTYTPDDDFDGVDVFDYTVTDGRGGSATGTVTVTVAAAVVDTELELSTNTTRYNNTYVSATVTAPGATVDGAVVTIKEGSRVVKTATVTNGKVKVYVGKGGTSALPNGDHTFTVSFPGTETASAATESVDVKIGKKDSTLTLSTHTTRYRNVYVYASVSAPGGSSDGGTIAVKEGGRSGKLLGHTKASGAKGKIYIGKVGRTLKPGKHTFTVFFGGTSTTSGTNKTITVTLK